MRAKERLGIMLLFLYAFCFISCDKDDDSVENIAIMSVSPELVWMRDSRVQVMVCSIEGDNEKLYPGYPTIYRIDRILELQVLDEHFNIPYKDRFEEGEYRKRIQFMYGGKLQRTKFWYKGTSVEAILDRLPTAKILKEENGKFLISAETFGKGIDMWLRSQGDYVEVVKN